MSFNDIIVEDRVNLFERYKKPLGFTVQFRLLLRRGLNKINFGKRLNKINFSFQLEMFGAYYQTLIIRVSFYLQGVAVDYESSIFK